MSLEPVESVDLPARARDLFARASAGVDQGMAFRLLRARREALAGTRPRTGRVLVPAGAMAAAALALGLAWWLPWRGPASVPAAAGTAETTEIERLLAGEEDPEMFALLADAPVSPPERSSR